LKKNRELTAQSAGSIWLPAVKLDLLTSEINKKYRRLSGSVSRAATNDITSTNGVAAARLTSTNALYTGLHGSSSISKCYDIYSDAIRLSDCLTLRDAQNIGFKNIE